MNENTTPQPQAILGWKPPTQAHKTNKVHAGARIGETTETPQQPLQAIENTDNRVNDKKPRNTASQPISKLTHKQRKMADNIVHEGMNATDAYIEAYDSNGKRTTAYVEASRTLSKPQVKLELAQYTDTAKLALVELIETAREYSKTGTRDGASYASVLEKTANSVIDRVEGKSKQITEVTTKAVVLNIDLTQAVQASK